MSEFHEISHDGVEMRYDSTGMFHWCTPRRIAEAEITKEQCAQLNLQVSSIFLVQKGLQGFIWVSHFFAYAS